MNGSSQYYKNNIITNRYISDKSIKNLNIVLNELKNTSNENLFILDLIKDTIDNIRYLEYKKMDN